MMYHYLNMYQSFLQLLLYFDSENSALLLAQLNKLSSRTYFTNIESINRDFR